MSVAVSGGTGFVGLNLVEALLGRGEHVVVAALDDIPASAQRAFASLPGKLTAVRMDVTDAEAFATLLRTHAVDRLFPFAAITSGPAREAEMPERIIQVNLLGVMAQMRAARDAGVKRVIAPSSAAVYGESFYAYETLNETTTPPVPTGIYGVTKYGVERSALRLGDLWGLDVIAARIGSVFGPWERDTGLRDMIGPHWRLARAARDGTAAVLPTTIPAYTWVYSRDVAAGLLHLLDMPAPPHRVFNICSNMAWGDVITQWADRLTTGFPGFAWRQGDAPTIAFSETRPRGRMDNTRLCATGWSPRFPPEAAYADYLAWLRADPTRLDA